MAMIKIYQFQYLDRASGVMTLADDSATERAITEIGATILQESCREVDECLVGRAGYLISSSRH